MFSASKRRGVYKKKPCRTPWFSAHVFDIFEKHRKIVEDKKPATDPKKDMLLIFKSGYKIKANILTIKQTKIKICTMDNQTYPKKIYH